MGSYLRALATSAKFRSKILLLAAGVGVLNLLLRALLSHSLGSTEVRAGILGFVIMLVALLIFLFFTAKTDKRVFTISPQGISTTRGRKSDEIPWKTVKIIEDRGKFILIGPIQRECIFCSQSGIPRSRRSS